MVGEMKAVGIDPERRAEYLRRLDDAQTTAPIAAVAACAIAWRYWAPPR